MLAPSREVAAFTPVSHLWWGLWAVMQATISTIDFDYLHYAELRLREYRKLRPGFSRKASAFLLNS